LMAQYAHARERAACTRDRGLIGPKTTSGPHCRFLVAGAEPSLHAQFVISAGEKIGLEHLLLERSGHPIVLPRVAQLRVRGLGITARSECARQGKMAPWGSWLRALEQTNDFARLDVLEPEHLLGVPAENRNARPARVCGDESKVARAWKAVAVAQNDPLDELASS